MDTKVIDELCFNHDNKILIANTIMNKWEDLLQCSKEQVVYDCEELKCYFVWRNDSLLITPYLKHTHNVESITEWINDFVSLFDDKIKDSSMSIGRRFIHWMLTLDLLSIKLCHSKIGLIPLNGDAGLMLDSCYNNKSYQKSDTSLIRAFKNFTYPKNISRSNIYSIASEFEVKLELIPLDFFFDSNSGELKQKCLIFYVSFFETDFIKNDSALLLYCLLKGFTLKGDSTFAKKYQEFQELFRTHYEFITEVLKINLQTLCEVNEKGEVIDLKNIFSKYIYKNIFDSYLKLDTIRFDIDPYDMNRMTDPNQGLWDLWEQDNKDDSTISLKDMNFPLIYARNPKADIRWDGNVAIDFGTRSTVVAFQEKTDKANLMRIGTGQLAKEVKNSHYENPTILECINLDDFMKAYCDKAGRPDTKWEDLTSSYTAASDLFTAEASEYSAFLQSLKQWAGDSRRSIQFKDRNGKHYVLPAYEDMEEDAFDPIEIYAYYIGLAVNSMRNGIYLDYTLSFPVTYEKKIRDRILRSFSRGIQKSLPEVILNDEETMEHFHVRSGASEPAAYALCALQTYNFNVGPEGLMYGVFDFGGGTTDFDFGILEEATGKDARRYDYVLTCFGSGGDKYLGGENLLELLAYEVFKKNEKLLREKEISFTRPVEGERFAADEILVSTSQSSEMNTRIVMEAFRPFWEKSPGFENMNSSGVVKLNLYNRKDEIVQEVELEFDNNELEQILKDRIEKGVINFFEALRLSFKSLDCWNVENVHCLLAGNSSRSQYVKEIFDTYIEKFEQEINQTDNTNKKSFILYPPLGTPEADAHIAEQIGQEYESTILSPTGKTGVVYGLLKGRSGGRIKVVQNNYVNDNQEIRFPYYIGFNKRGKFYFISSPETPYNEWVEFIDAGEIDSTLYYSNLPEASQKSLDIEKVSRKKISIQKTYDDENIFIFYRIINPTTIEYAVGKEDDIKNGIYLEEPKAIRLED